MLKMKIFKQLMVVLKKDKIIVVDNNSLKLRKNFLYILLTNYPDKFLFK